MRLVCTAAALAFLAAAASGATHVSANFRVHYAPGTTTPGYARSVADDLETAWTALFGRMGYDRPAWMNGTYVEAYIRDLGGDLGQAIHPARSLFGSPNPYILVNLEAKITDRELLRATCGHEFFHLVQYGYSREELSWLYESTATWAEEEIYRPAAAVAASYGFRYYRATWARRGLPLTYKAEGDAHVYASSLLWYFLSTRDPGDPSVVRRTWASARAKGENTFAALGSALGDPAAWGLVTRARIAELAVVDLVRHPDHHARYSLEVLRGGPPAPGPEAKSMHGLALAGCDRERLGTLRRPVAALAFDSVEIVPEQAHRDDPGELTIAAAGVEGETWAFHLVRRPATGPWEVLEFPSPRPLERWTTLAVPSFPSSGRLFVVATNLEPFAGKGAWPIGAWEVAAAVTRPLFVSELLVRTSSMDPDWRVVRSPAAAGGLDTAVTHDAGPAFDPAGSATVVLETSRRMKNPPTLRAGDVEVPLTGTDLAGRAFIGTLPLARLAPHLERVREVATIPIAVSGEDVFGARFDEDVATAPYLLELQGTPRLRRWEGEKGGPGPGGTDCLGGLALPVAASAPVLEEVLVDQMGPVYEARWDRTGRTEPFRSLSTPTRDPYDAAQQGRIELRFDRPVGRPELSIAGVRVKVEPARSSIPSAAYAGDIPVDPRIAAALATTGRAAIRVVASTAGGLELDAEPATWGRYDAKAAAWRGYQAGPDLNHALSAELSADQWTETGVDTGETRPVRLDWSGDVLRATVRIEGQDVTFTGKQVSPGQIHLEAVFDGPEPLVPWLGSEDAERAREHLSGFLGMGTYVRATFSVAYQLGGTRESERWTGVRHGGFLRLYAAGSDRPALQLPIEGGFRQVVWSRGAAGPAEGVAPVRERWIETETATGATREVELVRTGRRLTAELDLGQGRVLLHGEIVPDPAGLVATIELRESVGTGAGGAERVLSYQLSGILESGAIGGVCLLLEIRRDPSGRIVESKPLEEGYRAVSWRRDGE